MDNKEALEALDMLVVKLDALHQDHHQRGLDQGWLDMSSKIRAAMTRPSVEKIYYPCKDRLAAHEAIKILLDRVKELEAAQEYQKRLRSE